MSKDYFYRPNKGSNNHVMARKSLQAPNARTKDIDSVFFCGAEKLKIRLKQSFLTESSPGNLAIYRNELLTFCETVWFPQRLRLSYFAVYGILNMFNSIPWLHGMSSNSTFRLFDILLHCASALF